MVLADARKFFAEAPTGFARDALGRLGLSGWMKGVQPLAAGSRVAGRAVTMRFAPKRGEGASAQSFYSVLRTCEPGDVLVVDALDTDGWLFGENIIHWAIKCQSGGVVVSGRARDAAEIRNLPLGVFTRGAAVAPPEPQLELVDVNVPINCAGAQVRPGDFVVGDDDGVVVIPQQRLADVLYQARDIQQLEIQQALRIEEGDFEGLKVVLRQKKVRKE